MARKNKLTNDFDTANEEIIAVDYNDEMQKSYIDYAISVITDRAIPDVRDGLKPVNRRILWTMKTLGLKSSGAYKKSARIVGDTMGKYHPHGDASIYDAMVHMAQNWCYNHPLVDGHGNFGSIEGDQWAASRYTEAKLTKLAEETMLADIDKGIVDFRPNFDNSENEPVLLPAQIPNILISGTEGIAVGMASKMPPHNLGEVLDATIALLKNPKLTTKDLMQYIKGPDFPTGGIISNASELPEFYESGLGKMKVRAKLHVEEAEKGRNRIVITEIPYTMIGATEKFMDTVADLVRSHAAPDIVDIRNFSGKEGVRIIIDLKKGANVQRNINILYKKARLEDTFGYNALLLCNGAPKQMSLVNILDEFLQFYTETMTRKYQYLYQKEIKQKEIKEGLLKAIDCVDAIIEVLRGAKTVQNARECLMNGDIEEITFRTKANQKIAKQFCFTEAQASAILEMKMQRLIGLEIAALTNELEEHSKNVSEYNALLNSPTKMKNRMRKNLEEIKQKYSTPRKTEIINTEAVVIEREEIKEECVYVLINKFGYIKTIDVATYERNKASIPNDYKFCIAGMNVDKILLFTDIGKRHAIKILDIPTGKYNDKGIAIEQLCSFTSAETLLYVESLEKVKSRELVFVTKQGWIKRVSGGEFDASKKTIDSTKLNENDTLVYIDESRNKTDVVLISASNLAIRFKIADVSLQKKNSIGVRGYKLPAEYNVRIAAIGLPNEIIHINEKQIPFSYIKLTKRDAKGTRIRIG